MLRMFTLLMMVPFKKAIAQEIASLQRTMIMDGFAAINGWADFFVFDEEPPDQEEESDNHDDDGGMTLMMEMLFR